MRLKTEHFPTRKLSFEGNRSSHKAYTVQTDTVPKHVTTQQLKLTWFFRNKLVIQGRTQICYFWLYYPPLKSCTPWITTGIWQHITKSSYSQTNSMVQLAIVHIVQLIKWLWCPASPGSRYGMRLGCAPWTLEGNEDASKRRHYRVELNE